MGKMIKAIRQFERRSRECSVRAFALAGFVLLTVFLVGHSVLAGQSTSPGKVMFLDINGLNLLLQSDPNLLLIDVRTPQELAGPLGHIPQSRNVTLEEIQNHPEQFPRNKTLVLICRTGHRSLKAANVLAEHGYIVYTVNGGMRDWQKLHPSPPTPAIEAPPKKPSVPGMEENRKKTVPQENEHRQPPEKNFFDSNMGC
jgi:rhodanese-related sulfurtransferase